MADKVHIPQVATGPASEPSDGHQLPGLGRPFFLAGGALLLGIPVYLAQRRHLTPPGPVPACR